MSNLEGRSNEYEVRVAKAGTTDELMHGLVQIVEENRRITLVMIIAVIVGFLVGGVALIALMGSRDASTRSHLNQKYITDQCVSGNVVRKDQRDLWSFIIGTTPPNSDARIQNAKIMERVNNIFQDRDCADVRKGKVTEITPSSVPAP